MLASILRISTLALLAPVIVGAAISVRLPVVPVCNRTALYLLAKYKVAVGDSRSAVELLTRAAAAKASHPISAPACPATQIHERT